MRAKQNEFLGVVQSLKSQKADLWSSQVKKKLVDTKEAIEIAAHVLESFNVTNDQYATMLATKQGQIQNMITTEIDLDNMILLVQNSADTIGSALKKFVGDSTKKSFTSDVYYTTTKEATNGATITFSQVEYIQPNYKTNLLVKRIRNRISAGYQHVLVLLQNGKLYSTGQYVDGNLGRPNSNSESRMLYSKPVEGLDGLQILQFEANYFSNLVLTDKGVYSFGKNDRSQLGTGNRNTVYSPTKVYGFGGQNIAQIALGYQSAYAIDTNGKLWAWGANDYGQLGDRTYYEKARPVPVYSGGALLGKFVTKVCGGGTFGVALTSDGILVSMGDNSQGQLGANSGSSNSAEPVRVYQNGAMVGKNITDIQCGYDYVMALAESGEAFVWGYNGYYQFGDGSTTRQILPKLVTWSGVCTIAQIHTRYQSSFVLCKDNRLFVWGRNDAGQLGVSYSTTYQTTPVQIVLGQSYVNEYQGYPKLMEITSNIYNSFIVSSEFKFWSAGNCGSTSNTAVQYFYSPTAGSVTECTYLSGRSYPSLYVFNNGGTHTVMRSFNSMSLPVYMRKLPYFEAGSRGYMFMADLVNPTRANNGFGLYYKDLNLTDTDWVLVERDVYSNTGGFPVSIYNSHFLKLDEYVYFFGGFIDDEISNKIYRAPIYDVENGWELMPNTLPYPVASGMTIISNGYYYLFGGITQYFTYTAGADSPSQNVVVTNSILRAPLTNISDWSVVTGKVLPSTLHSAPITIIDQYIYLFGGSPSAFAPSWNIYRALLTDPSTWEMTFGLLPFFTSNSAIVQTNSEIYLFGGTDSTSRYCGNYLAVAKKSDPVGSWIVSAQVLPSDGVQHLTPVIRNNTVMMYSYDIRQSASYSPSSSKINRLIKVPLNLV